MQYIQQNNPLANLPGMVARAIAIGYQTGAAEVTRKQQQQSMVDRIMLQNQLSEQNQLASDKRRAYSRRLEHGWSDITNQVGPPTATSLVDQYGTSWEPPRAPTLTPEQAERYEVISGSAPGQFSVMAKPKPKYQIGDTREVKTGGRIVTEEFTKEQGWVEKATSPQWEPDQDKPGDITFTSPDRARKVKVKNTPENVKKFEGAGWEVGEPTKVNPEVTPSKALKRISDIKKAKAELGKSNTITALIVAANPDLAGMLGQSISDKEKQDLFKAWDEEEQYLRTFIKGGSAGQVYTYTESGDLL